MIPLASPTDTGLPADARIIPLRGFSGCHVLLVSSNQSTYVRKLSRDADYNKRLLQQAEKQKNFTGNDFFHPVKVRASGQLPSGIAYIDMDYVPGVTAAEILTTLPLADIQRWSGMLLRFASAPEQGTIDSTIFKNKIVELQTILQERNLTTPAVAETLARLRSRPWTGVPHSPCHGDLTLENILAHDGQLYLIDFLDSFADSWYMDMAKLMQDLIGGWSFRYLEADRNLVLRLASLRHSIESALEEKRSGCVATIHDLYALSLLRILPYSSAQEEQRYIEGRLSAALNDFL